MTRNMLEEFACAYGVSAFISILAALSMGFCGFAFADLANGQQVALRVFAVTLAFLWSAVSIGLFAAIIVHGVRDD